MDRGGLLRRRLGCFGSGRHLVNLLKRPEVRCVKVTREHVFVDDPVLYLNGLGGDDCDTRKVPFYRDGRQKGGPMKITNPRTSDSRISHFRLSKKFPVRENSAPHWLTQKTSSAHGLRRRQNLDGPTIHHTERLESQSLLLSF